MWRKKEYLQEGEGNRTGERNYVSRREGKHRDRTGERESITLVGDKERVMEKGKEQGYEERNRDMEGKGTGYV